MRSRVRVLGAGIIGLSVAEELIRRGHEVTVIDPAPGSGASYAAAGMLSPSGEAWHGEEELTRLCLSSLELWPEFAARLGVTVQTRGTLLVGADAGDVQQVERQLSVLDSAGIGHQRLSRRELIAREPQLGRVSGGAYLAEDHSVDPREVVAALLARVGDRVLPDAAAAPDHDVTVIATGARLPEPYAALIRPVRGDIIRVLSSSPVEHTVRAWVHGEQVYVVPRRPGPDGTSEVVIGATAEERDGPLLPTVEGAWRLLDSARRIVPSLDRAALVEVTSRDRPGTADNLPLIGPTDQPGVFLAAGAYRNGVLLAPLIGRVVAEGIGGMWDTRSTGYPWT